MFFQIFQNKRSLIQTGLILAGICSVILGIYAGEVKTILTKAIYICLECIGIG